MKKTYSLRMIYLPKRLDPVCHARVDREGRSDGLSVEHSRHGGRELLRTRAHGEGKEGGRRAALLESSACRGSKASPSVPNSTCLPLSLKPPSQQKQRQSLTPPRRMMYFVSMVERLTKAPALPCGARCAAHTASSLVGRFWARRTVQEGSVGLARQTGMHHSTHGMERGEGRERERERRERERERDRETREGDRDEKRVCVCVCVCV